MNTVKSRAHAVALALAVIATLVGGFDASAQEFGESDRTRGKTMLNVIKRDLQKNYYDPSFRSIDLDARFKTAEDRIATAQSNGEIFGVIAQALADLKDSHTVFIPPSRAVD